MAGGRLPALRCAGEPVLLATGHFGMLEAPRDDGAGGLWFADVLGAGILRRAADGALSPVAPRRGAGGLVRHARGGIVAAGRGLARVHQDGRVDEALAPSRALNDLTTEPGGSVLAGELTFRPFKGESPVPGRIVRFSAGGGAAEEVLVDEGPLWPNGMAVTADGATLVCSDFAAATVLAYPRDLTSGALGEPSVFAASPRGACDGLALDEDGGVWVALGPGGAVARFTAAGELEGVLDLPASFVSSCAFAGADRRTLVVTTADNRLGEDTGGALFAAPVEVAGAPVALART